MVLASDDFKHCGHITGSFTCQENMLIVSYTSISTNLVKGNYYNFAYVI